ncbi:MAG TPA: response regulator [Pyrinomonadaceae bacterium]|nr:response regulator [Pyrinomonadaceae bacterium]
MSEASQTILVVNDNTDHLELMRVVLAKAGYRVLTALDGREGLHLALTHDPDLVISDVNMPALDGIELCRRLRAEPRASLLPIMLVSAERVGCANAVEGLRAGADDYLELPFDPIRMVGKVVRLLERKQAEEALRASEERYRLLFENNPLPMWVFDAETLRFLDVNGAGVEQYGYSRAEFLRMTIKEIRPPEEVPALLDALKRREPSLQRSGVLRHRRRDGTIFDAEVITHPILFEGRPAVMVLANDVTERKRAEEQLERSNEQLRALSVRLQAVREEEAVRIAREIHDELGGALTGLKMDLSWIGKRLSEQSRAAVQQKLQSALELIDETVVKVRNISTELRPSVLDDLGLAAAIEWQAREFQRRTEIRCEIVSLQEETTLSAEKSTAVFRIFQEILTNVARHAQASLVNVRMEERGGCLILEVSDNGRGIKEEEVAAATSIGLLGMRERAMIFGGRVEVTGDEGRGTTVTVRIPLA